MKNRCVLWILAEEHAEVGRLCPEIINYHCADNDFSRGHEVRVPDHFHL
jgi:hypothetical protein